MKKRIIIGIIVVVLLVLFLPVPNPKRLCVYTGV